MATIRIYQGRIVQAYFEDKRGTQEDALAALETTNRLFQDAVNYHMVALAGMAGTGEETLEASFRQQIRTIWEEIPRGVEGACSLQRSLARTLNLPTNVSFDDTVACIFEGCERMDILPYVEHYVIERVHKGTGGIQQQGREILPKLCDPAFSGNFDYSIKERRAAEGKKRLQYELNRPDITENELRALAQEMDLSWAGVKTKPNASHDGALMYEENEVYGMVDTAMKEMLSVIEKRSDAAWVKLEQDESNGIGNLLDAVLYECKKEPTKRSLAKNNKVAAGLKQAAIFFMFYPGKLSAKLLAEKIGREKVKKATEESLYDFFALENDPLMLARGKRGYIYKGFTALPNWEVFDNLMYSNEWDILAFKEALKTLHGFELKTQERKKKAEEYARKRESLENGSPLKDEDEERDAVALKGDPRFELMQQLVKELSPNAETEYHITSRTLKDYDEVQKKWMEAVSKGDCTSSDLVEIVREHQSKSKSFGSALLFETLCRDEYKSIWLGQIAEDDKLPRSKNMLLDFSRWQCLRDQEEKYKRIVQVTAADVLASPRQMMYSDIEQFGKGKGWELLDGSKGGGVRLRVPIRNGKHHWEAAAVRAFFSAPRFVRDELTSDPANWKVGKKENTSFPWVQPMMKALGCDEASVRLERTPAMGLQVKGIGSEARFYLNFPVTLNMAKLQQAIGKNTLWKGQFCTGDKGDKLHLHWPNTLQKGGYK